MYHRTYNYTIHSYVIKIFIVHNIFYEDRHHLCAKVDNSEKFY